MFALQTDLANALRAQKALSALKPDPQVLARAMLAQTAIAANGVPHAEIARVMGEERSVLREIFANVANLVLSYKNNSLAWCELSRKLFESESYT